MNARISLLTTCPGTRIGKPGGYGMTNIDDTTSRRAASCILSSASVTYVQRESS
jgi:hypothetical protein